MYLQINGIVREYTFSRLDLHDGGNYTVKLIACNGAQMCVEDESHGITVDSSPPTPGRQYYTYEPYQLIAPLIFFSFIVFDVLVFFIL